MEHAGGGELSDYVTQKQGLPEFEVMNIIK
jgi:hypothetical protein